ncbi:protein abrupt isoform X12 [Phlebotomus papatasi]|uniref:protein abrupt isoform X12 n=1 Tax=Phlebotomus papatasi TaxID=29031 RepID=UPI0024839415|nr:protein abrupt isoform X12 [Phlebotomus papatasi]XP_055713336.1 protein abrupt isoform X12 [Phlebotomus papatasi]
MTESTQLHQTDNSNSGVKMEPPVSPAPSEQQYSLKWNDFQSSILSSFRHLRDEEDFVDVTLACDQRSFTAHKVVLSACSPYFRKLLKANPCEHPIVILRDVRAEDVESLLRFMYNGEVHIGHEQLSDFLKTAQLLQVRGLADVSGPSMGHTMTSSSRLTHAALNTQVSTPTVQELKPSPVRKKTSGSLLPWDLPDDRSNQNLVNTPPPQKRIKSIDLYRAQHGLSPDRNTEGNSPSSQGQMREKDRDRSDRESDRSRKSSLERDRSLELRDSLLGQALEGGPTLIVPSQKHPDLASLQQQSNGEDSNSSDAASDREDGMDNAMDGLNGSIEHSRTPSFPSAFLGLQGLPLMPGPSGMHADNFGAAEEESPMLGNFQSDSTRCPFGPVCPQCGKMYSNASNLRQHLRNVHATVEKSLWHTCPECGKKLKTKHYLINHQLQAHGIHQRAGPAAYNGSNRLRFSISK